MRLSSRKLPIAEISWKLRPQGKHGLEDGEGLALNICRWCTRGIG